MRFTFKYLIVLICGFNSLLIGAQTTSWKGVTNTNWTTASNWTSGVPTSTVDAIIGDANFTGSFQPALNGSANCKNLSVGSGLRSSTLSIANNITVWGSLSVGSNGTILANSANKTITLKGNWTMQGAYSSSNSSTTVTFSGSVVQTITGNTTFRRLTISANATVLLASSITVNNRLSVSGVLDPTDACLVNGTGTLSVSSAGTLMVYTSTFSGNYALSGTKTLNKTSTVDYLSNSVNQTISGSITHGKLKISGGASKSLVSTSSVIADQLIIDPGIVFYAGSSTNILVKGSITNNGTLYGQSSIIRMDGSATNISGSGVFNFNHLTLEGTSDVTLNAPINVMGNLTIDGAFDANGYKVAFIGSSNSTISGSATAKIFDELEQNKTSGYTALSSSITIANRLSLLAGKINTTSTNYINMADNSTASSGSSVSFVNGPMRKTGNDAFVFPIGKGTKWARLGISAPSNASDAFTVEYFDAAYSNTSSKSTTPGLILNNVSIVEYWDCARSVGSSAVTVQLFWENTLSGINNYSSDLVVAHWNGSAWENKGQTGISSGISGNITSSTNTSFSPFTFGSLSPSFNPLPITLLNFDGKMDANNQVELNWRTVSETNNKFFTLERSSDGFYFTPFAEIQATGNSNSVLSYQAVDLNPNVGYTYYRLKQTDFNGNLSYAKNIVSVFNGLKQSTFAVYPNPSAGLIQLDFESKEGAVLNVKNNMGASVYTIDLMQGSSQIDLSHLPAGVYVLCLESALTSQTCKLIKN
jgi:hypothetical protein